METNNKPGIKSFWAIVAIVTCAFIAGGVVMWAVYNSNLQEDLLSLVPRSNSRMVVSPSSTPKTTHK